MTDANFATWVHIIVEVLTAMGGLIGAIAGLGALLARRTFASKDDVDRRFAEHAIKHEAIDQRLANGETHFARLSGAIEKVELAAEQAKEAADEARDAVSSITNVSAEIAELKGSIKSIEQLTLTMVNGHMASSFQPSRRV